MSENVTDARTNKFIVMNVGTFLHRDLNVGTSLDGDSEKKTSIELTMPNKDNVFEQAIMIENFDRDEHSELIKGIYVFAELRHRLLVAKDALYNYIEPDQRNPDQINFDQIRSGDSLKNMLGRINNVLGLLKQLVDGINPDIFSVKNAAGDVLHDQKVIIEDYYKNREVNVILGETGVSFVKIEEMSFFKYIEFIYTFIMVETNNIEGVQDSGSVDVGGILDAREVLNRGRGRVASKSGRVASKSGSKVASKSGSEVARDDELESSSTYDTPDNITQHPSLSNRDIASHEDVTDKPLLGDQAKRGFDDISLIEMLKPGQKDPAEKGTNVSQLTKLLRKQSGTHGGKRRGMTHRSKKKSRKQTRRVK